MISTEKVLNSSSVWCAEIVTSNVIKSPPLMWKKVNIQWGMGIVSSQVCEISWHSLDRFIRWFLLKQCLDHVLGRWRSSRENSKGWIMGCLTTGNWTNYPTMVTGPCVLTLCSVAAATNSPLQKMGIPNMPIPQPHPPPLSHPSWAKKYPPSGNSSSSQNCSLVR